MIFTIQQVDMTGGWFRDLSRRGGVGKGEGDDSGSLG